MPNWRKHIHANAWLLLTTGNDKRASMIASTSATWIRRS